MSRRYLLVSHIPFMRLDNVIMVDQLWANDLIELTANVGPIRLAAPEISSDEGHAAWGPKAVPIDPSVPITFISLPPMKHSWDLWTRWKIQRILKAEVEHADIVHSSNAFNPYLCLLYAHFQAARLNKKTVFVVAEDYHDSLIWEWVRLAKTPFQRFMRDIVVSHMDRLMQEAVAVASLSLLFTPAVVRRFRLYAANGIAVRDTTHTLNDIISEDAFAQKCQAIASGTPLKLVAACRHKPLKGLDYIIRAIAELKKRDIYVEADLYGDGPMTAELTHLAKYLDVDDRVRLPGILTADHKIFKAIADAHIGLMLHRTNEFARALYDSLAGATPVLAFRTPASEGSVRDGTDGMLIPLDNAIALAVAIERLNNDRSLLINLCKNSRDRAKSETRTIWHKFRSDLIEELFSKDIKT